MNIGITYEEAADPNCTVEFWDDYRKVRIVCDRGEIRPAELSELVISIISNELASAKNREKFMALSDLEKLIVLRSIVCKTCCDLTHLREYAYYTSDKVRDSCTGASLSNGTTAPVVQRIMREVTADVRRKNHRRRMKSAAKRARD